MRTWTVVYDVGHHEEEIAFTVVKAQTEVEAAIKVGNSLEKKRMWTDGSMEFRVFEGPEPTPIILTIERSVTIKQKEGDEKTS